MTGTNGSTTRGNGGFVVERLFSASRAAVFRAWTDPEQVKRWWGPEGFTIPFCQIDLRPGGSFHLCMRSPEGHDIWCKSIYQEIVVPERLVSTVFFSDAEGSVVPPSHFGMADFPTETLATVTFTEQGAKTLLTLCQSIPGEVAKRYGAPEGWDQSFERLAAIVEAV